jgi:hypothetical protein
MLTRAAEEPESELIKNTKVKILQQLVHQFSNISVSRKIKSIEVI